MYHCADKGSAFIRQPTWTLNWCLSLPTTLHVSDSASLANKQDPFTNREMSSPKINLGPAEHNKCHSSWAIVSSWAQTDSAVCILQTAHLKYSVVMLLDVWNPRSVPPCGFRFVCLFLKHRRSFSNAYQGFEGVSKILKASSTTQNRKLSPTAQ